MSGSPFADNIVVILNETQQVVNIGGTVRALLNTGFRRLRLVAPAAYDPARIDDMAHRSGELVRTIEIVDELDAALADIAYVVGFSARPRADRQAIALPDALPTLAGLARRAPVALLFGREDRGLDNAAIERCTHLVAIPTDPAYPSLNLADAALLVLYELRQAWRANDESAAGDLPAARQDHAATMALLEQAMLALNFAPSAGQHAATLRTFRDLLSRAAPDEREITLIQALCRKIIKRASPA